MNIVDAIKAGDLAQVREILGDQPNTVSAGSPGEQPIHYASWFNQPEILDELLNRGADIDATDAEGRTPLHYAALNSHVEPARRLIARRAKFDLCDKYGFTPLVYAIQGRSQDSEQI